MDIIKIKKRTHLNPFSKLIIGFIYLFLLSFSLTGCTSSDSTNDKIITINTDKEITSFIFRSADNPALDESVEASITHNSITAYVPIDTDISSLIPTIIFRGASISPESGTEVDFTSSVTYTATAEDNSVHEYSVDVAEVVVSNHIYVDNDAIETGAIWDGLDGNTYSCEHGTGAGYSTIQAAVAAMSGGDDIYIRGGTYYEHDIYIAPSKNGTLNNWSTMQSYPGEWAVIDGQRSCSGSNVHSVIYNGGFAHSNGDGPHAKYWKFTHLEITGGGLSGNSATTAAGIWWNQGPAQFRYLYIHDNLADNADENPAGFNGCSQQNILIEYCYFKNNGSIEHEHGNSRNICFTGSTEYSSTVYDENWYVKQNEIRYNLIDTGGGTGIATKAVQRLTATRDGSDLTNMTLGDKIHHNIIINTEIKGILWQQDFVQIYNNIIKMSPNAADEDWGIATRRIRSEGTDVQHASVYNNLVMNNNSASIFHDQDSKHSSILYYYCFNNIIDNHNDDWDRWDISVDLDKKFTETSDLSNIHIDRNYFYRCDDEGTLRIGKWINGDSEPNGTFTNSQWETENPGSDLYQNNYNENDLLYIGVNGANQYITRPIHIVEGSKTISTSGIGSNHPYLSGVTIPSYIGATGPDYIGNAWEPGDSPDDGGWVDYVYSLLETSNLIEY